MACEIKLGCAVVVLMLISNLQHCVLGAPQVPCYFIFGDSLADNGNNNALSSLAKVNYPPYGIDFPFGPTGRFTNGATAYDIIGQLLGFDNYIPSFVTARTSNDILRGVNYASGAAGIRDETGFTQGDRFTFNRQLANHILIYTRIVARLGSVNAATQFLNRCLYAVGMGSNDYLNNYFLPQFYITSRLYNPEQYAQVLINQYAKQLKILYQKGARKVALFSLGRIGCTPYAIASFPVNNSTGCAENINDAVQLFDNKLRSLVDQLNSSLPNSTFIYINSTGILSGNLTSAGFTVLNRSCCQVSNVTGLCIGNSTPCPNRNQHFFWDAYHPTEAVNRITASRSVNATGPSDAYPYGISRLVQSA